MKRRLMELINNVQTSADDTRTFADIIATELIANGVIVPPMKLGQICFEICTYRNEVEECRVSSITQKANGSFKIRVTNIPHKFVFEITPDKIGKTIFLTKEEAEKALERSENGT